MTRTLIASDGRSQAESSACPQVRMPNMAVASLANRWRLADARFFSCPHCQKHHLVVVGAIVSQEATVSRMSHPRSGDPRLDVQAWSVARHGT